MPKSAQIFYKPFFYKYFQISKYRVRMGIRRFWLSGELEWVL